MDIDQATLEKIEIEQDLLAQVKDAKDKEDYEAVKTLMQKLIDHQRTLVAMPPITDEELVERGFDILLIRKERDLRDRINQANQDGDFVTAKQLMRELRQVQKLQPKYTGVKLYEKQR
jgi:hypothetical protein